MPVRRRNMEKTYDPKPIENKWYQEWLSKGKFHADADSDKPSFSIVIPPPNVTGSLHMGHAFNNTFQDIMCRFKRMQGYNVLWLPGTDHAGIATQNVVERQLAGSRGDPTMLDMLPPDAGGEDYWATYCNAFAPLGS